MADQGSTSPHEMGTQPLDRLMTDLGLKGTDLVAASTEQLTHKMVTKARRGRRLTGNVQRKILAALNQVRPRDPPYRLDELFSYH